MAKLSAEQIRDRFGLDYNEKHASSKSGISKYGGSDSGAIYNKTTGEYVGTLKGFKPAVQKSGKDDPAEGIDAYKKIEDYGLEHGFRDQARTRWNTMNDVAGAVNDVLDQGEAPPPPPTAPEEPVGQSEKLVTARTRVKQYEEDVLGGRKVFGDKSFEQNDGPSFLERYKLKLDEEYEQDPNDGLYVKRSDADRYRTQMDDYNKQKAEYDSKYGGQN